MCLKIFTLCLVYVFYLKNSIHCEDIFGCGGFVKSNFPINYSRVEVKLYTKQGSLKYQTDCAPNNGYYLIPLYDKGNYILKIEPPQGWTFEPNSVSLHVDGKSDPCSLSQDINFIFKGFIVEGQVLSHGITTGPAGVDLALKTEVGKVLATTTSGDSGSFIFNTVLPGKYIIEANHKSWMFEKSSEAIEVVQDNVKTRSQIIISGFDVQGSVVSDGEPIQGVKFLLFNRKLKKIPSGCNDSPVKEFKQKFDLPYVCHVTSSKDGKFTFPSLPPGNYRLVPFYKGEHIEFDVSPAEIDFTVEQQSLEFSKEFQVQGFSVSGIVSTGLKGKRLSGADIYVNGNKYTTSDSNGVYHLENMRAGTYEIEIKLPHIFFDPVAVKITPNTPRLSDIYPTKFSLCGQLIIDEYPDGLDFEDRSILFKSAKKDSIVVPVDSTGHFCSEVEPAKYEVEPILSEAEISYGIVFSSDSQTVEVIDQPVTNIVFKQFSADMQGVVKCIEKCDGLFLELAPLSHDRPHVKVTTSNTGQFELKNCLPGNYILSVEKDDWCFQSKAIKFTIDRKVTKFISLEFQQTGFQAAITLTHASAFDVKYPLGKLHKIELQKLKNVLCLPEPGIYEFIPVGCHKYQKDSFKFDTLKAEEIKLSPTKHLVTGTILTELNVTDIVVVIQKPPSDPDNAVLNHISLREPLDKKGNLFRYPFSVFVQPNVMLDIKATSEQVLFKLDSTSVIVEDDCLENAVEIIGKKGVFIKGSVSPALQGVTIQVFVKKTNSLLAEVLTDESGLFVVGPVESENDYSINAQKEGYVITPLGEFGKFLAHKLAEIVVSVENENSLPLSGALLSLSGGTDYRKNRVTKKDGKLAFSGLEPGQYFLRSMLKEYLFDPPNKMIDIKEGTQVSINIRGKRVAYSLYGVVNSITGEAEVGVVVETIGAPGTRCSQYQEESISEQGGLFRIRGLQPDCEYILRLKAGADINQHIERSTPRTIPIKIEKGDVTGIRMIVFRYFNQLDISGNIITDQEFLSTMKVRLFRDTTDQVVNTLNLGQSSFFFLPSIPIDDKTYLIKVESSLPRNSYYVEEPTVTFRANVSFHHFTIPFHPRLKTMDQEVNQGSVLAFPITVVFLLLAYNYQKLLPFLNHLLLVSRALLNPARSTSIADTIAMPEISSRKKLKPKKAQ